MAQTGVLDWSELVRANQHDRQANQPRRKMPLFIGDTSERLLKRRGDCTIEHPHGAVGTREERHVAAGGLWS